MSLFLNSHRERLCTASYTAYNALRFAPNNTTASQDHLTHIEWGEVETSYGDGPGDERQPSPEAGEDILATVTSQELLGLILVRRLVSVGK